MDEAFLCGTLFPLVKLLLWSGILYMERHLLESNCQFCLVDIESMESLQFVMGE
jgi:hypothetical protein